MNNDRFLRRFLSHIKCNRCGQTFEVGDVNVLGNQDELWFLSVSCPMCHNQGLVAAVIRDGKGRQVATELTEKEFRQMRRLAPLTMDDVLDMHNFLKAHCGTLIEAMGQGMTEGR